jgi:hypothetical protein
LHARSTGVVDDEGIKCGERVKQFELRKSLFFEVSHVGGRTAWVRAECEPPSPPPDSPSPPPPQQPQALWPAAWSCYAEHPNINLPAPLVSDRCSVRFHSLEAAQQACSQRIPEWYAPRCARTLATAM